MLDQQDFLKIAVAAQASAAIPVTSGTSRLRFGEPQPFSYEWLKSHAQDLAAAPYHAPAQPDAGIVAAIDYDTYGHLKYKPDSALYGDGQPGVFPITFPVRRTALSKDCADVCRRARQQRAGSRDHL